jgi:hypothetical protein
MAFIFKSLINDILIKIVSSRDSGLNLTAGSSRGSSGPRRLSGDEYIQVFRLLFNLNNNDRLDFNRVLIHNLWNARYYGLIGGLSDISLNGDLFKTESGDPSTDKLSTRIKYYFIKLFKINRLLYGPGLINELSGGFSAPGFIITKNCARLALWYLLYRASLKEIEAFDDYYSKAADKTAPVKMLIEESAAAFKPFADKNPNKTSLQKLKFYYNDISECSHGQKRREAEYKYYIISEYIDDHYMNWALMDKSADENDLLYDALRCRFESMFERQIRNAGDGRDDKFNINNLLKKAEICFDPLLYKTFSDYFSDLNIIKKNFYEIIEFKSKTEPVFIKYKDGISFELFKNSLAFIKNKAVYNYIDWCSDELNSAECHINDKFLPDIIYKCFEDIENRASEMLIKEISRWANENIINIQILDKSIITQNRMIIFNGDSTFNEEIISDDKLKALSEKFHSLHVVFICRINNNGKAVRELYRLITPTCDYANNRLIFHSDFAPLETPYAKGVILKDKIFEYDGFNTWYGGRDKIHRSQLDNPYSASLIKRMAEDINSILS